MEKKCIIAISDMCKYIALFNLSKQEELPKKLRCRSNGNSSRKPNFPIFWVMIMGLVKEWHAHGLRCRVLDGPFKNYNGYVAVPKEHPAFAMDYDELYAKYGGILVIG